MKESDKNGGTNIFVSYRRNDAAGDVNGLVYRLKSHFGEDRIFRDIHSIEPGKNFRQVINDAVGSCEILLAVIGKNWLTVTGPNGQRRIDDPNDFVHLEIATALRRNIRVVPVLVQDATVPAAADLPDALKELADRHALEITDISWEQDIDRLIETLEKALEETTRRPRGRGKLKLWLSISCLAAAALAITVLGITYIRKPSPTPPPKETGSAGGTPAPQATENQSSVPTVPDNVNKDEPDPELVHWERIRRSTNANDFREYLRKYPNGVHAQQARRRLSELEGVNAPPVVRNTIWAGKTTSGRRASYIFSFADDNSFTFSYSYEDEPATGRITGSWNQTDQSIEMFVGEGKTNPPLYMKGQITGNKINGSTINRDNGMSWTWTVTRK